MNGMTHRLPNDKPNVKLNVDWKKEMRCMARDYLILLAGTLIAALSYAFFFMPHDIAPGGLTGIAMVLAKYLPLGAGFISFCLNVPLFIVGRKTVGLRFAVRSFMAMTLLSLFIDLIPKADIAGEQMLASIFGGVLSGVGFGLVIRAGASTGGTDMAAKVVHKVLGFVSVGTAIMALDMSVVFLSGFVFGISNALWAAVSVFIASAVMDIVIKGFNTAMQFLIVTSAETAIISRIHKELGRGCTRLEAVGTFSGKPVGTLICVVSRVEVPRLRKLISEEDPRAFVTVSDVQQALGEGFSEITDGK